ncbi:MAG: serine/threonine protein kinase [Curvibacter sp.]|nr:serine/threonine protein kinase [Curvibacter sp.]
MADILTDPAASLAVPQVVTHADALPPGTQVAEFEIRGLLGAGGFGLVYRAYDTSLQRTVAIKEYMPSALAARPAGLVLSVRSASELAAYQSGLQSFIAEARLLAQFDHPSLVKVYRFFEANNTAYMVMPLYRGITLKEARNQMSAPPSEEWLRTVLWSVLQGLRVLHRNDTLHRDLSPDNIFLQDMGPPVLLDLGAARRAISDKSQKITAVLKVNYAPIEQFARAEVLRQGPWTDLYALAAVVYSCLHNDPPVPATLRLVRDSQPSVRSVVATVKERFGLAYSDEFVRTIQHALSVQPSDRPQSLAAFFKEMKLKAPPPLSKFDWRVKLGASLRCDQKDSHSRQFWHTELQTVAATRARTVQQPRRKNVWWPPALLGAVVLVCGGYLTWVLAGKGDGPATPVPTPAPEPVAATPSATPSATLVTDAAPAEPARVAPAAERAAAAPPPTAARRAVIAPAPAAAPARAPAPVEVRKPMAPPPPKPEVTEVRPAAGPVAVPEPAAAPESAPATRELCAQAGFFVKSMCIHQECKKPENARLPVCIEDRRRYQDANPSSPP